jgi:hypothetical protein
MKNQGRYLLLLGPTILFVTGLLLGADEPNAEYIRKLIPEKVAGTYKNGELVKLTVGGRNAYIVKPKGKADPGQRWIWIFPPWLGINEGHDALHHRI